jgi:twinkle protein
MFYDWASLRIDTRGRASGEVKTLCPNCSSNRKHNHDRCLSVNVEKGIYNCHNGCGFSGKADRTDKPKIYFNVWQKPAKVYGKPKYQPQEAPPADKLLTWFASRGIPADIVRRHKIERRQVWMPQTNKDEAAICFPYFRDGEVVNVKYRDAAKNFRLEKDAELCLYGLDDIRGHKFIILTEGEIDKLSCEVAGFPNALSVPNGANTNLDCMANDEALLADIERVILAGDGDAAGEQLTQALITRFGRDRCWRVEWPEGCKDANDVLVKHGVEALAMCLEGARPVPIEGVFEVEDLRDEVAYLYNHGRSTGVDPGWKNVFEFYRPRLGDWTAVLSIPGAGKTSFLAALMVNLAWLHDWRFAVFPAENLPAAEYVSMLLEIYTGKPFNEGPTPRMTRQERDEALDWVHDHFVIFDPGEDECDLDRILGIARAYCLRRGIKGLVIDPWNELDHKQPVGQTQTQYIGASLRKIRRFSKAHSVHTWVVVHPTKLQKDKEGQYPVPTLYDADGSAHWRNKCDNGIVLYRHYGDDLKPLEVHFQKIRWRWCGKIGRADLYFDTVSGRYSPQRGVWDLPEMSEQVEQVKGVAA